MTKKITKNKKKYLTIRFEYKYDYSEEEGDNPKDYPDLLIFDISSKVKRKNSINKIWNLVQKYSKEYLNDLINQLPYTEGDDKEEYDREAVLQRLLKDAKTESEARYRIITEFWDFGRDINDGKVWISVNET